jgi:hypothetical protein
MFGVLLVFMLGAILGFASARLQRPHVDGRVTVVLLVGYAVRLAIAPLTKTISFFASGIGYDSGGYELLGKLIVRIWQYTGIHYVTGTELPYVEGISLPPNVFACVIYLNDGPTHLGCTAIVAATACFVCLDVFLLSRQLGAPQNVAFATMTVITFLPSFLFYTSDTYKDGFVSLFVIGSFGCSIRLARRFSVGQVALALAYLVGLWLTRFYLVFIVPGPLLLGILGVRSRSIMRVAMAAMALTASAVALLAYSGATATVADRATETFERATSPQVRFANAQTASGVLFDESTPTKSFVPRLLYTLFSPFPWQSGSLGFQIGKLDAFVWYYFMYRAVRSVRLLVRQRRIDVVLMFASLIVPLTVAYSMTFANVGLMVRQRLGIVVATMLFATLSWSRGEEVERAAETVAGNGEVRA